MGEKEYNYSFNVIQMLSRMESYTAYLHNNTPMEKQKLLDDHDYFDHYVKEDIKHLINIPQDTLARKIYHNRDFYEFEIKYDAMYIFFNRWEEILKNCTYSTNSYDVIMQNTVELTKVVDFISKILILNPDLVENFQTDIADKSNIHENVRCIVDKFLRSLDYLKTVNDKYLFEKTIANILDCIRVLIENKYRGEVAGILTMFNDHTENVSMINSGYSTRTTLRNGYFSSFLKNVESPTGKRLVSKAFTKLCSGIMKNSYPSAGLLNIIK